jgi:hypothetical protein
MQQGPPSQDLKQKSEPLLFPDHCGLHFSYSHSAGCSANGGKAYRQAGEAHWQTDRTYNNCCFALASLQVGIITTNVISCSME